MLLARIFFQTRLKTEGADIMGNEKNLTKKIFKNSLSKKIVKGIAIPVIIIFALAAFLELMTINKALANFSKLQLAAEARAVSYQVSEFFTKYIEITKQLSVNTELENLIKHSQPGVALDSLPEYTNAKKTIDRSAATDTDNILAVWVATFKTSQFTMSDGFTAPPDWDVTARPWYKVSETKTPLLTSPYVDDSTNKLVVTAVSSISDSVSNEIIGAAGLDISLDHLKTIMSGYKLGKNGFYLIVDAQNQIVYHPNSELIQKNIQDIGISNNMISNLDKHDSVFGKYSLEGLSYYGSSIPIGNTGLFIISGLPGSEYTQEIVRITLTILFIFFIGMCIVSLFIRIISKSMVKPLKELTDRAEEIASGNLEVLVDIATGDEIGEVGTAFSHTVSRLKEYINYINEIEFVLNEIAQGNLKFELKHNYSGEFAKIKTALLNIQSKLAGAISDITNVASQVAEGSNQIAQVAHTIAESSTEQCTYIDELTQSIHILHELTQNNTVNAQNANSSSDQTTKDLATGNHEMSELTETISQIHETSGQIRTIMQTMDDIATQTNLLSLNASIEAARAGEAGRGFAIVANEVGSLASQSTIASGETAKLISIILDSIELGTNMTKSTAKTISDVIKTEHKASGFILDIYNSTSKSEEAIQTVSKKVERIMVAVESNTAASEESVAASEELAAQSGRLRELVSTFRI